MPFPFVSIIAAVLFFATAGVLFVDPETLLARWAVADTAEASFIGRIYASALLGLGVICLLGFRGRDPSARKMIRFGVPVVLIGAAIVGGYEFQRGFVSDGIFEAIGVEVVLALALLTAR